MVIENNGNLAFYDDQGFIYQDSPSNSSDYQSQSVQSGSDDTSWFSGGTLQQSTVAEWRQASYANRLATSADFIAATQNVDYGNLGQFKQWATDLETCVSTAVSGGDVDNEKVSLIAAMCFSPIISKIV